MTLSSTPASSTAARACSGLTLDGSSILSTTSAASVEASDPWGVKVLRYEIRNINPPADVLQAMEKQMRAEREKRAIVLTSEGERDAQINQAEGEKQRVIKESEAKKQQLLTAVYNK